MNNLKFKRYKDLSEKLSSEGFNLKMELFYEPFNLKSSFSVYRVFKGDYKSKEYENLSEVEAFLDGLLAGVQ